VRPPRGIRQFAALCTVAAAVVAGCGAERTFTASEFVQQVNEQGVTMRLGAQRPAGGGAERLYAVKLPPLPGEPQPPPGSESGPGASGSLYVFGDPGGAEHQFEACQDATGLVCFRASNIVVVLDEESGQLEPRRLAIAIQRLAR
jgi:hypothetical protein